jgi:hypothetical protein
MFRLKRMMALAAVLVGAAVLGTANRAQADFVIRATEVDSNGNVVASNQQNFASNPDGSGFASYSSNTGTPLPDFAIVFDTHIATTGPGFTKASETLNIQYTGPTGGNSDTLILEVLGNGFSNPTAPAPSFISSNGSPSTSGLQATSIVMTSGVIAGNVTSLDAPGTTLGGQLGETTGTGTLGMGLASSVLNPNPAIGATFNIVNPFSFYQTYTISGFVNSNEAGSLSAGSTVSAVPAPAGIVLALAGLPVLGVGGWLRRRAVQA